MKIRTIREILHIVMRNPQVFYERKEYIFIISHMRSFSSLLSHILGTHSAISGYAEMHQLYRSKFDLLRLRKRVYYANDCNLTGRFVLDKIVDESCDISNEIIRREDIRVIFVLRKPEQTLKSIIRLGRMGNNKELTIDQYGALRHYNKRLDQISRYALERKYNTLFIDAEKIVDTPDEICLKLTEWLNLEARIEPEYRLFKYSGVLGYGDPSPFIMKGSVVKRQSHKDNIHLKPAILELAQEKYRHCREVLTMFKG